ncbi:EthD family reductase [Sphingomonas sp. A2-49]|uniref:EthD family reductase n=1 Tax=Sphingomonas sp. A2-49 TaxID=1391375 RepID=UPI0021D37D10|nr:EthD family reductase [Sphingomonas sp. A2-49]MCU6454566.1 EthD family reductase [Sphingomonas sp. A2-49]
MSAALLVSYPVTAGARFDRDYYVATHLPLVRDRWGPHGLIDATGMWPDDDAPAHVAVALLTFRDADARDAALASAEAAAVFGDLPNFTDIAPVAQRLTPA